MSIVMETAAAPQLRNTAGRSEVERSLDRAAELVAGGATSEAEALLNRAWVLAEAVLDWSDPLIANVLLALGDLQLGLERYGDAEGSYQYALFVLDDDASCEASAHHGLALALDALGIDADADRHARKALELRERALVDPFDITCGLVACASVLASHGGVHRPDAGRA